MTENRGDSQDRAREHAADAAALKALLGRARRHAPPSAAARERAFAAVQAEWRAAVQAPGVPARATGQPRRRLAAYSLAAGIAVLSVAGALVFRAQQAAAPALAVAEAVTGGAGVDRAWWRGGDEPLASASRIVAGDRVVTPAGAVAGLRLSAGLAVRLAPGSRLRLDSADSATLESGTVFVDADPRRGRAPLRIATPHGVVSHLGTQYTVGLDGAGLEVAVREGEVAVLRDGAPQRATAGEMLRIDATGAVSRERVPVSGERWGWLALAPSPVDIDGRPLADFLYWYARETGVTPRFADAAAGARIGPVELHGSVAGLAPDDALAIVATSVGLAVKRDAGVVTLDVR